MRLAGHVVGMEAVRKDIKFWLRNLKRKKKNVTCESQPDIPCSGIS
jgi:hypothetical protein